MSNDTKEQEEAKDPVGAIKENLDNAKSNLDDADQEEQSIIDNLGDEVTGSGGTSGTPILKNAASGSATNQVANTPSAATDDSNSTNSSAPTYDIPLKTKD